jgi:hypothetical protein
MTERTWMKKCCEHCPFKRETALVLHPERASEFAYMTENPYNDFPCHKTADEVEETDFSEGGFVHGENSFTCHGFKGMQVNENSDEPTFRSDGQHFLDVMEMEDYHEHEFAKQRKKA